MKFLSTLELCFFLNYCSTYLHHFQTKLYNLCYIHVYDDCLHIYRHYLSTHTYRLFLTSLWLLSMCHSDIGACSLYDLLRVTWIWRALTTVPSGSALLVDSLIQFSFTLYPHDNIWMCMLLYPELGNWCNTSFIISPISWSVMLELCITNWQTIFLKSPINSLLAYAQHFSDIGCLESDVNQVLELCTRCVEFWSRLKTCFHYWKWAWATNVVILLNYREHPLSLK